MNAEVIQKELQQVIQQHGQWTAHNIHLGHDIYTRGKDALSWKTLRFVQTIADIMDGPLDAMRVLDLACLEGGFAIEFARHGAQVVGIEGRETNLAKARFAKDCLGLQNLEFYLDDVRNLSVEKYGQFDVVLCAGILYHLDAPDVFHFIDRISDVCKRLTVIDTSFSLRGVRSFEISGGTYFGNSFPEHENTATNAGVAEGLWDSIGNASSFWLTQTSLLNMLMHVGFTSVFEVQNPSLVGQFDDRVFLAAIKGVRQSIHATPAIDQLPFQDWPENPPRKFDAMQRRTYRVNKKLTALVPKPLRRAAKSALQRCGLRHENDAPWNWSTPWRSR